MPPCLTLSIIRYGSRVKWSNPGRGVAPSPIPWCSNYQKGSLWVTLDNVCQLYFTKNDKMMISGHLDCNWQTSVGQFLGIFSTVILEQFDLRLLVKYRILQEQYHHTLRPLGLCDIFQFLKLKIHQKLKGYFNSI